MRIRLLPLLPAALLMAMRPVAAEGLSLREETQAWPQWQARLSLATGQFGRDALANPSDAWSQSRRALIGGSLLGDYYFPRLGLALPSSRGGFRATSGLMFGTREFTGGEMWSSLHAIHGRGLALATSVGTGLGVASDAPVAAPYLGIGYTGVSAKGQWGFSADLGLTAEPPTPLVPFGRALLASQGAESTLRELRLLPLLRLGFSYSY